MKKFFSYAVLLTFLILMFTGCPTPGGQNIGKEYYVVHYASDYDKDNVPDSFNVPKGTKLTANQLPALTHEYMIFDGWYAGGIKVNADSYEVTESVTLTAHWSYMNYPITYNLNGGTNAVENISTYTVNDAVFFADATRDYYTFAGWYDNEDFTGSAVTGYEEGTGGAKTLYAKWTPVRYAITYVLDDKGTNVAANPSAYTIEDEITLADATSDEWGFGGWFTDSTFTGTQIAVIARGGHGDLTLYAKWAEKRNVTYVSAYGTQPEAFVVTDGTVLSSVQLASLTDASYLFIGWYSDEEYSTQAVADTYKVSGGDVTLYAKWLKKCNITYVTTYGAVDVKVIAENTSLTAVYLPYLYEDGYVLRGWYTETEHENKISTGYTITEDMTLYAFWEEYTDGFVFIEGGTFTMGRTLGSGDSKELPTHSVTLSDFYMSPYEMTQKIYTEIMGSNPSIFKSSPTSGEVMEERPVEYVTWNDAIYFCNKYSEANGFTPCYSVNGSSDVNTWGYTPHRKTSISGTITCDFSVDGYRLPTEAEWEYAAKGGKNQDAYLHSGSNTLDDVAWYDDNSEEQTHQVGLKVANSLGLYDMSGNVAELCWDWYSNYTSDSQTNPTGDDTVRSYRVVRDGAYCSSAPYVTCNKRFEITPYYDRGADIGFRLVRSVTSPVTIKYVSTYNNLSDITVTDRTQLSLTELPYLKHKGYVLRGWYKDATYTNKVNIGDCLLSDTTLFANWEEYENTETFVLVEGGTYTMGRTSGSGEDNELPTHSVTLSDFYMSQYEVTQRIYTEVMGTNPSYYYARPESGEIQEERPVEQVSWYDAIYFCNKYSEENGFTPCYEVNGSTDVTAWSYTPHNGNRLNGTVTCNFTADGYRLPTEAEWEYAAKGGKNQNVYIYSGSNSYDDVAWYSSNSNSKTHQIGLKVANTLGLYDMSGNVREWCWDRYGDYTSDVQFNPTGPVLGYYRVERGGAWNNKQTYISCTYRFDVLPYESDSLVGFRLVRSSLKID